jgi:hypothetical protein
MRIIRHDSYIAKRKRQARWISLIGFAVLTSTLFIGMNPTYLLPAYAFMLIGFVVFNMGMQQMGKWSRNPRNDQLIDRALSKLSDRFTVIHFAPVDKRRVDHVVIYPGGIVTLISREITGQIQERGSRWSKKGGGFRRLLSFSGPQLNNPSQDADSSIAALESFLEQKQLEVDVEGAIVFVHPQVQLDIQDPDYPVLHADELPEFLNSLAPDPSFSAAERDRLVELLSDGETVQENEQQTRRRPVRRRAA